MSGERLSYNIPIPLSDTLTLETDPKLFTIEIDRCLALQCGYCAMHYPEGSAPFRVCNILLMSHKNITPDPSFSPDISSLKNLIWLTVRRHRSTIPAGCTRELDKVIE